VTVLVMARDRAGALDFAKRNDIPPTTMLVVTDPRHLQGRAGATLHVAPCALGRADYRDLMWHAMAARVKVEYEIPVGC